VDLLSLVSDIFPRVKTILTKPMRSFLCHNSSKCRVFGEFYMQCKKASTFLGELFARFHARGDCMIENLGGREQNKVSMKLSALRTFAVEASRNAVSGRLHSGWEFRLMG